MRTLVDEGGVQHERGADGSFQTTALFWAPGGAPIELQLFIDATCYANNQQLMLVIVGN